MSLEAHLKLASWPILSLRLRGLGCLLADCHNSESDLCCPSIAYLAEHGGVTERAIQAALRELEGKGVISIGERFDGIRQTTNEFFFEEGPDYHQGDRGEESRTRVKKASLGGGQKSAPSRGQKTSPGIRKRNLEYITPNPKPKSKSEISAFVLPPEVDPKAWEEFEAHRIELHRIDKKKNPLLNDQARRIAVNKLRKLSREEQRACVETAVLSGWKGLFPKSKPGNENQPTRARMTQL